VRPLTTSLTNTARFKCRHRSGCWMLLGREPVQQVCDRQYRVGEHRRVGGSGRQDRRIGAVFCPRQRRWSTNSRIEAYGRHARQVHRMLRRADPYVRYSQPFLRKRQ
jgi:hypothetical protein